MNKREASSRKYCSLTYLKRPQITSEDKLTLKNYVPVGKCCVKNVKLSF